MARCLRCKAGNEWIEGDARRAPKDGAAIVLTPKQAKFLRSLLQTHADVCTMETAELCSAVLKKLKLHTPQHGSIK
jgi:hypothetical protein